MSLQGKNIIITGGTGGIGQALITYLSSKGANIAFSYNKDKETAQVLEGNSDMNVGKILSFQVDVKEKESIKQFAHFAYSKLGKVDVLINNAGIRKDKSLLYMQDEEWKDVLETNLTGTFYTCRAFVPYMLREKSGRIINISSISGINGMIGQVNYSSSKAGIIGLTKSLAKEMVSFGISVNAIAPGPVDTDMLVGMPEDKKKELIQQIPAGRALKPEEFALVANFLADEELSPTYLTGQVITLDGGMGL